MKIDIHITLTYETNGTLVHVWHEPPNAITDLPGLLHEIADDLKQNIEKADKFVSHKHLTTPTGETIMRVK